MIVNIASLLFFFNVYRICGVRLVTITFYVCSTVPVLCRLFVGKATLHHSIYIETYISSGDSTDAGLDRDIVTVT